MIPKLQFQENSRGGDDVFWYGDLEVEIRQHGRGQGRTDFWEWRTPAYSKSVRNVEFGLGECLLDFLNFAEQRIKRSSLIGFKNFLEGVKR